MQQLGFAERGPCLLVAVHLQERGEWGILSKMMCPLLFLVLSRLHRPPLSKHRLHTAQKG